MNFTSLPVRCVVAQTACFLALSGPFARAAESVAEYPFTGNSLASTDASPNTAASDLEPSGSWQFLPDVTAPAASPSLGMPAALLPSSLVTTLYLGFTVTAEPGFTMDLGGLDFLFAAWDGGPAADVPFQGNWVLRSSLDFFASDIASGSVSTGGTQDFTLVSVPLGQPQFANLGAIEFRLFAFGNGTPQGLLEFDGVELVATVVPEPAAPALLLAGAGACWALRRRHAGR